MSTKQTLIVIGNGMVGQYFLTSLANSELSQQYQIVTFCEEAKSQFRDRGTLFDLSAEPGSEV